MDWNSGRRPLPAAVQFVVRGFDRYCERGYRRGGWYIPLDSREDEALRYEAGAPSESPLQSNVTGDARREAGVAQQIRRQTLQSLGQQSSSSALLSGQQGSSGGQHDSSPADASSTPTAGMHATIRAAAIRQENSVGVRAAIICISRLSASGCDIWIAKAYPAITGPGKSPDVWDPLSHRRPWCPGEGP